MQQTPWQKLPVPELLLVGIAVNASSSIEFFGWRGFMDSWWNPLSYGLILTGCILWALRRALPHGPSGVGRSMGIVALILVLCFAFPSNVARFLALAVTISYAVVRMRKK